MDFKDYYATLGVPKAASAKEIKQAFRKLARAHHPDVNPNDKAAESKFKEINEAYEVLGDPEKRKKYDELGTNWRAYEQAASSGAGGPGPGGAWTIHFGGAGGGFRPMTGEEAQEAFGGVDPFSDFFHTFFGGGADTSEDPGRHGRIPRGRGPRTGRDLEQEIALSLEDAYHGTMQRLSLTHNGHARTVDVRIPAGVGDGARVRVAGEGERGTAGGPAGNLYLRIRVAPHPVFERRGKDVHVRVAVPLTTAVLGGEADVPTLAGKPLRLKIPPTTQNAQVFRLKGHGMPVTGRPGERGDLYATIEVALPRHLSAEQRQHFEALRTLEQGARTPAA